MLRNLTAAKAMRVILLPAALIALSRSGWANEEYHPTITRTWYDRPTFQAFRYKHYSFHTGPRVLYYHSGYIDGGVPFYWTAPVWGGPTGPGYGQPFGYGSGYGYGGGYAPSYPPAMTPGVLPKGAPATTTPVEPNSVETKPVDPIPNP